MKAIQCQHFGDASVLVHAEIDAPTPLPREILVRVKASGVNPIEWKIRSGAMAKAIGRNLPVTFGWACAGVVEAVGTDVGAFKIGDGVYAYPEFTRGGTHADLVVIEETQAALKPAILSFVQASAVPMTAQAAWTAADAAIIHPGERVLIHGAAGAVGHWLIQFAKGKKARVIATASGDGLNGLADLGADQAIDYRRNRFEEAAGKVDVVFDLDGGETQTRSWGVLGSGGRLVSTAMPPDDTLAKAAGAKGIFVFTPPRGDVLSSLAGLIDAGKLRPLDVVHEFALTDAAHAHTLGETGKSGGKMALVPDEDR